jgi:hypothetical protein
MSDDKVAQYRQLVLIESSRALTAPTRAIALKHEALADHYLRLIETMTRRVANDTRELPDHTNPPSRSGEPR